MHFLNSEMQRPVRKEEAIYPLPCNCTSTLLDCTVLYHTKIHCPASLPLALYCTLHCTRIHCPAILLYRAIDIRCTSPQLQSYFTSCTVLYFTEIHCPAAIVLHLLQCTVLYTELYCIYTSPLCCAALQVYTALECTGQQLYFTSFSHCNCAAFVQYN